MKVILISLAAIFLSYAAVSTALLIPLDTSKCMSTEECLLTTHWKQMGGFEKYTPDGLRTGCWSTALAQIVYYHRLKPFGRVQYTSRNGYKIDEQLDSLAFDFNDFTAAIDSSTPLKTIDQLARYNYCAALAVEKDFGTDRYMNKLASASLLEAHYKVKVERFISWHRFAPYSLGKLESVITRELENKRPVFLHFANLKDFGHSVVIDGFCYREGKYMVHINQGQGGDGDGWFAFYEDILHPGDKSLRVVYTFQAKEN